MSMTASWPPCRLHASAGAFGERPGALEYIYMPGAPAPLLTIRVTSRTDARGYIRLLVQIVAPKWRGAGVSNAVIRHGTQGYQGRVAVSRSVCEVVCALGRLRGPKAPLHQSGYGSYCTYLLVHLGVTNFLTQLSGCFRRLYSRRILPVRFCALPNQRR